MPKKRGGQPGNQNAFKHGFYSKYFNAFESKALSEIPLTDMIGEIGLMRVNVDRFMQVYTSSLEKLDYEQRLSGLRAITLAVGRIVGLERILSTKGKYIQQYEEFMKMLQDVPEDETSSRHSPK
jgi:ASC-1-like (ASCH) protein